MKKETELLTWFDSRLLWAALCNTSSSESSAAEVTEQLLHDALARRSAPNAAPAASWIDLVVVDGVKVGLKTDVLLLLWNKIIHFWP